MKQAVKMKANVPVLLTRTGRGFYAIIKSTPFKRDKMRRRNRQMQFICRKSVVKDLCDRKNFWIISVARIPMKTPSKDGVGSLTPGIEPWSLSDISTI